MRTLKIRTLTVISRLLLGAGMLVVGLFCSSISASAEIGHDLVSQINEAKGVGLGSFGLSVNASGELFVLGGGSMNVFSTAVEPKFPEVVNQFGVGGPAVNVAAADATGDVYVSISEESVVDVFRPEGAEYKLIQERRFQNFNGNYVFVAVNNSTVGVDAGDVYVNSGSGAVLILTPNAKGELPETPENELPQLPPPKEGFSLLGPGNLGAIAVDRTTGEVYVASPGTGVVDEYDAGGAYVGQVTGPADGFTPVSLALEDSTGDLYAVDDSHGVVEQFDSSGKLLGVVSQENPSGGPVNVAVNQGGYVYVSTGGPVDVFGPSVSVPAVSTGSASDVRKNATLEGTVNPEGEEVTSCEFEYGTSTLYGHVASCASAPGSGTSAVAVSAEISGLELETTYHYRLVAAHSKGSNPGVDETFTTTAAAPDLQTEAATGIEQPAAGTILATVNGSLAPDGVDTHYYFEYGETEAYGSVSPALPGTDAGTASKIEHAETQLSGLNGATTYHYRLVATNSFGTTTGADMQFTTPSIVPDLQTEAPTNVEVSGAEVGATLNGSLAPDGSDTHYYFEYGETEAYGSVSPALPGTDAGTASKVEHVSTRLVGLKPYAIYHYRLVATDAYGTSEGADMSFNTSGLVAVPTASGLPASNITQFTATLNGLMETGDALVNYHFEYYAEEEHPQILTAPVPDSYAPIGGGKITVSQPITDLTAGTTYRYWLVISSPGGTDIKGPEESFTTEGIPAPTIQTGAPTNVAIGSVTLNGTINPHSWNTTYLFQYGTSTAYGLSWPSIPVSMGALEGPQPVVVNVPNLLPSTTYHYRLIATNGGGTSYGEDQTFTTGEYPHPVIQEPAILGTYITPPLEGTKIASSKAGKGKARKGKSSKKHQKTKTHHAAKHKSNDKGKRSSSK